MPCTWRHAAYLSELSCGNTLLGEILLLGGKCGHGQKQLEGRSESTGGPVNTAWQCCETLCNVPWQPEKSPTSSDSLLECAISACVEFSCTYTSSAEFADEEQFMLNSTPLQGQDWIRKSDLHSLPLTQGSVWKPCQKIAGH